MILQSNVIKALEFAKKNGAITIGFTGMSGGMLPKICDYCYVGCRMEVHSAVKWEHCYVLQQAKCKTVATMQL